MNSKGSFERIEYRGVEARFKQRFGAQSGSEARWSSGFEHTVPSKQARAVILSAQAAPKLARAVILSAKVAPKHARALILNVQVASKHARAVISSAQVAQKQSF